MDDKESGRGSGLGFEHCMPSPPPDFTAEFAADPIPRCATKFSFTREYFLMISYCQRLLCSPWHTGESTVSVSAASLMASRSNAPLQSGSSSPRQARALVRNRRGAQKPQASTCSAPRNMGRKQRDRSVIIVTRRSWSKIMSHWSLVYQGHVYSLDLLKSAQNACLTKAFIESTNMWHMQRHPNLMLQITSCWLKQWHVHQAGTERWNR